MDTTEIFRRGKLLLLAKLLMEKTDEQHHLTLTEIQEELAAYGIHSERKSLYRDMETLRALDMDIITERDSRQCYYYIGGRKFELAEVKTLVDAVQASRFITAKKSEQLIRKLETLTSCYEANDLHREVFVSGRVKNDNENIYYNVDVIHTAISRDHKINFQYYQRNLKKKKVLRHDGRIYSVSPWALVYDNENYYLVGYDDGHRAIRHYRVDKMVNIEETQEIRAGKTAFRQAGVSSYSKTVFGMYEGPKETVILEVKEPLVGVMVDRFGESVSIRALDKETAEVRLNVKVSDQFLGWLVALGEGVRVKEPADVQEQLRNMGKRLMESYT